MSTTATAPALEQPGTGTVLWCSLSAVTCHAQISSCRHHCHHHLRALAPFRGGCKPLGWAYIYLRILSDIGKFSLEQGGKLDTVLKIFLVPLSFFIVLLRLETRASDGHLYGLSQICARASGICFTP